MTLVSKIWELFTFVLRMCCLGWNKEGTRKKIIKTTRLFTKIFVLLIILPLHFQIYIFCWVTDCSLTCRPFERDGGPAILCTIMYLNFCVQNRKVVPRLLALLLFFNNNTASFNLIKFIFSISNHKTMNFIRSNNNKHTTPPPSEKAMPCKGYQAPWEHLVPSHVAPSAKTPKFHILTQISLVMQLNALFSRFCKGLGKQQDIAGFVLPCCHQLPSKQKRGLLSWKKAVC